MLFCSFDIEKTRTPHFSGQREHWKSHSQDIPKAHQSKNKQKRKILPLLLNTGGNYLVPTNMDFSVLRTPGLQMANNLWPVHTTLTCVCLSTLPHIYSKSLWQKSAVSFVFSMQPGHGLYPGHLSFGNPGKCSTHTSLKPDDRPISPMLQEALQRIRHLCLGLAILQASRTHGTHYTWGLQLNKYYNSLQW